MTNDKDQLRKTFELQKLIRDPAAVRALITENERLCQFEEAQASWLEKTEWVQKTCHWSELGRHRADILRERIEQFQAGFKNFHRSLCERFGYYHDEIDWQRDQVSLEEHIATQFSHVNAENAALRGQVEALQRGAGQLQEENEALRLRCDRLDEDKQSMTETHVLYTWLRKKCDQPSNDFVAVQMNIGHDWVPVHDLDRDLRSMIEREEP